VLLVAALLLAAQLLSISKCITQTRTVCTLLLQVTLQDALIFNNTASLGGGISLRQSAAANMTNTTIQANQALRSGGGVYAALQSSLSISNGTRIRQNTAWGTGGGVACIDTCRLRVSPAAGSSYGNESNATSGLASWIVHNTANGGWGGGVLAESPDVVVSELVAAAHGNNASYGAELLLLYGAELLAGIARIALLSPSTVTDFVSRLGVEEGVLHVALRVMGHQDTPSDGAIVQAVLSGNQFLAANRSDAAGNVTLSLKVMKAPGHYSLSFMLPEAVHVPAANMSLTVRPCVRGEVTPSPDSCLACPHGYFSLNPADAVCSVCVPGAECPGGSVVLPQPGFWMSAADSNQVHR
jgi:hypothetical protein